MRSETPIMITGRRIAASIAVVMSVSMFTLSRHECVVLAVVYLFSFKRGCLLVPLQALRCGCHARLDATIRACHCLSQLMLIDEHIKRVVTNGYAQHRPRRVRHGASLCVVECFYRCVLDCDHVLPCCCCVLYACIIPSGWYYVKPKLKLFLPCNQVRLQVQCSSHHRQRSKPRRDSR